MKRFWAVVLALAMALSLVACGGNEPPAGQPTGAPSGETAGQPAEPSSDGTSSDFVIAVTTPMSEEYGAAAVETLDILQTKINAEGGVNGAKLRFEYIDALGIADQQGYYNAIEKAVNTPDVCGIIGSYYDAVVTGYAEVINNAKIPCFNFLNGTEATALSEYFWSQRIPQDSIGSILTSLISDSGSKHPVIILHDVDTWHSVASDISTYYANNGMSVAKELVYTDTTTDYANLILDAMNVEGADGVVLLCNAGTDGTTFLQTLDMYDYQYPVVTTSNVFSDTFAENTGAEACEGIIGYSDYPTGYSREETDEFVKLLNEGNYSYSISWLNAVYWDAALLMIEAAKISGENTAAAVQDGLWKIENFGGVMCDYTCQSNQYFPMQAYVASFDGTSVVCTGEIPIEYVG